jgi:nicotinamide mononucleotide adenylyltransferase
VKNAELAHESIPNVLAGFVSPVHDDYPKKGLIPSLDRLAMAERALASSSWISVSSWEANQSSWSRTLNVLRKHRELLEQHCQKRIRVVLLMGADVVASLVSPRVWIPEHVEEILSEFGIVCIERAGGSSLNDLIESHQVFSKNKVTWCDIFGIILVVGKHLRCSSQDLD